MPDVEDELPEYLLEYLTSPHAAELEALPSDNHRLRLLLTTLSMIEARTFPKTKANVTMANTWELTSLGATIWLTARTLSPEAAADPEYSDTTIQVTAFTKEDLELGVRVEKAIVDESTWIGRAGYSRTAPVGAQTYVLSHETGIGRAIDWLGGNGFVVIPADRRAAQRAAASVKLLFGTPETEVTYSQLWTTLGDRVEFVGALIAHGILTPVLLKEDYVPEPYRDIAARFQMLSRRARAYFLRQTAAERRADQKIKLAPDGMAKLDAWVESRKKHTIESMSKGPNPRARVYIPTPGTRCPRCQLHFREAKGCLLCTPALIGKKVMQ